VVLQTADQTQIIGEPGGVEHSPKCTQMQTYHSNNMNVIICLAPYVSMILSRNYINMCQVSMHKSAICLVYVSAGVAVRVVQAIVADPASLHRSHP